ncbi:hypothetical protein ARSQ2_02293 [Arsenophonus endosymbiont of Bemisia tabaci Q2]|nr:hypothetical protein ARSQ2_02293 [Arsenophonus endosymbiont of Bemisia tabaci Q2]
MSVTNVTELNELVMRVKKHNNNLQILPRIKLIKFFVLLLLLLTLSFL